MKVVHLDRFPLAPVASMPSTNRRRDDFDAMKVVHLDRFPLAPIAWMPRRATGVTGAATGDIATSEL